MTDLFSIALLLSVASCGFMTGLTTFVHVVHYPAFIYGDKSRGREFHDFHTTRTGLVVGLPMLTELVAAAVLLLTAPSGVLQALSVLAAFFLIVVWADTGLRVIPLHNRLKNTSMKDNKLISDLVNSNLLRTISWAIRFLVLLFMIYLLL